MRRHERKGARAEARRTEREELAAHYADLLADEREQAAANLRVLDFEPVGDPYVEFDCDWEDRKQIQMDRDWAQHEYDRLIEESDYPDWAYEFDAMDDYMSTGNMEEI